jgi:hypothetical protein
VAETARLKPRPFKELFMKHALRTLHQPDESRKAHVSKQSIIMEQFINAPLQAEEGEKTKAASSEDRLLFLPQQNSYPYFPIAGRQAGGAAGWFSGNSLALVYLASGSAGQIGLRDDTGP